MPSRKIPTLHEKNERLKMSLWENNFKINNIKQKPSTMKTNI